MKKKFRSPVRLKIEKIFWSCSLLKKVNCTCDYKVVQYTKMYKSNSLQLLELILTILSSDDIWKIIEY